MHTKTSRNFSVTPTTNCKRDYSDIKRKSNGCFRKVYQESIQQLGDFKNILIQGGEPLKVKHTTFMHEVIDTKPIIC